MEENQLNYMIDAIQSVKSLETEDKIEDNIEVENNKDINLTVDSRYKHIIFDREDLLAMINLSTPIVLNKSEHVVYNSITFVPQPEYKTITMVATNELSLLRYKSELIGEVSQMSSSVFSIPLVTLQKIVRLMGNKALFYITEDSLCVRLLDGDLKLDLRVPNTDRLKLPGKVTGKLAELSLDNFGSIISATLPIMNAEIKGDTRKISFTGEKAYYQSPFYYIESAIKTPSLVLKARDAEVISKLYNIKRYRGKTLQLFKIEAYVDRIKMIVDNIEYLFISGNASQSNLMLAQLERIMKEPEADVEYDRLSRLVNLSVNLPNSTGIITLEFSDIDLRVTLSSNRGNSNFILPIDKKSHSLFRKPVSVKAEPLRRLLSAFNNPDKVSIAFTDYSIVIEKNGVKAALMNLT